MRLIDADAFVQYIKGAIKRQKYENLKIDEYLTVADVLNAVISDLDGTSLVGFKNAPTIEPETCEGCKHLGKWENEVEYGYPSPCTCCKRRVEDHYESRKFPKNEVFIVDDAYKENVENLPYTSLQPEPYEEDEELDFVQEHKKLPIILEAREKAHWIEVGREEGALGIEYKTLRCSKCGWESSLPIPRKFCPECGRDMRGRADMRGDLHESN